MASTRSSLVLDGLPAGGRALVEDTARLLIRGDALQDFRIAVFGHEAWAGRRGRVGHSRRALCWLYAMLANVYERNGQPADARRIRFKAARGVTRTSPWWLKPIRWTYDGLTGHGYFPLRAAIWLILAIVAAVTTSPAT